MSVLYWINRLFLKRYFGTETITGRFLNYHFNDLLASMMICSLMDYLSYITDYRAIPNSLVFYFLIGMLCSVCWEIVAPLILEESTGDIIDCYFYILGTVSYYFLKNRITI